MKKIKITKKQKYIIAGGGVLLVSIAIAVPLIVQNTKHHPPSFNLTTIKNQMQMATKRTTTLENTKVAIVNMYQNGTTKKLSPQAQKAAHVLAHYIYANKTRQKFAFVLDKDHQDHHLLLLTIANHLVTSQDGASLQRAIRQAPINAQKQLDFSQVKQLSWVTKALHKAEFGILFWIYQNRLSGQEAMTVTSNVPPSITAVNFPRVKTVHEQLQDQAWAKMIEVVRNLTSKQLGIRANDQQLPSQTKITARDIMLAIQKIITDDDELSKAASKLMKVDNIEVQLVDKIGTIMITIQNYGPAKIITILGFKATATPLEAAQVKIKAAKGGASLPTRLNQVFHGQMPKASDVNAPMKDGVTFKFKKATAVNNKGVSTLTYGVDVNPQVKGATPQDITFVVSGFETQVQAIERIAKLVAQVAIQNLVASDFTVGINRTQIASIGKPNKDHVISDIKKQINNSDAQALILPGDITITPNNTTQTITIVIHHHGPKKTIIISGFISIKDYLKSGSNAIKDYLDQVLNAIPSSGGALVIPKGITSVQFDVYVQAMGDVLNDKGEVVMNKFAKEYKAKITSLTIPNSFTMIGPWFQHFDKITSLSIPNAVTAIGNYAFSASPLTTLSLGDQLQTIGAYAFQNAQLTSLHIPNAVTTIGAHAFASSRLTTLSLGDQLKTIGDRAFYNALLKTLSIPNAVTTIGAHAFVSSRLTTLTLGDQLQTIGKSAFYYAQLTSLHIPNAVTTIGAHAFASSPLTNITIFDDVTLGFKAFQGAKIIKQIPRPT